MKKLFITLALACVTLPVLAQHHVYRSHGHHGQGFRHHGHHHHHNHYYRHPGYSGWVAPLIIGGVVGAAIANRPTQTETLIIRQPVFTEQVCTEWKEIQANDGTIYRERTCTSIQK